MTDMTSPAGEAGQTTNQGADHIALLAGADPKAARQLAKAAAKAIEAEAADRSGDAEANRKARLAQTEANRREAKDREAERRRNDKAIRRRARKAEARAKVGRGAKKVLDTIRTESASTYAGFLYLVAVSVAVWSQSQVIHDAKPEWSQLVGVAAGLVIEGAGLAFYATSVNLRLDNRSGLMPRLIAWAFTGLAASMQYLAHKETLVNGVPVMSYGLAAITIAAMLLAEIRTNYKVGKTLEEKGQKEEPLAHLGFKFVLRYPDQAWFALSAMIANPQIKTRGRAIKVGRRVKTMRARLRFNKDLMAVAQRATKKAAKDGASGAVLMRLEEYAHYGLAAHGLQEQIAASAFDERSAKADRHEAEVRGLREQISALTAALEANMAGAIEASPAPALEASPAQPVKANPVPVALPAQPQPTPALVAQPEAKGQDEAEGQEANEMDHVVDEFDRWNDQLAELAYFYPRSSGRGAQGVPARNKIILEMKERKAAGEPLRCAWTSNKTVGDAMKELRELREKGLPEPKLRATTGR